MSVFQEFVDNSAVITEMLGNGGCSEGQPRSDFNNLIKLRISAIQEQGIAREYRIMYLGYQYAKAALELAYYATLNSIDSDVEALYSSSRVYLFGFSDNELHAICGLTSNNMKLLKDEAFIAGVLKQSKINMSNLDLEKADKGKTIDTIGFLDFIERLTTVGAVYMRRSGLSQENSQLPLDEEETDMIVADPTGEKYINRKYLPNLHERYIGALSEGEGIDLSEGISIPIQGHFKKVALGYPAALIASYLYQQNLRDILG